MRFLTLRSFNLKDQVSREVPEKYSASLSPRHAATAEPPPPPPPPPPSLIVSITSQFIVAGGKGTC